MSEYLCQKWDSYDEGHPLSAGPQDFSALDTLLTFNSNTRRVLVNISIINDEVDENQENLFTRLRLESVDASVSVAPDEATILIVDDDGKEAVNCTCTKCDHHFSP